MPRLSKHRLDAAASLDEQSGILEECFARDGHSLDEVFQRAYELSRKHFSNVVHFYAPGMVHYETAFYRSINSNNFPGISVTGRVCYLNCEHCNGQLLESMIPATTPQELFQVCTKIKREGGVGCLISGGSLVDGSVPLLRFIPTIKQVKRDLKLQIVVHTGLVNASLARALADGGIDVAMIDIIGSDDTIKEIHHLDKDVDSFDQSLSLLEKNDIPTVPHIVVGIHFGKLKGEKKALEIVSRHKPAAVVVVAFTPLDNTRMKNVPPSPPLDIARVALALRLLMPDTPILLGCARPRGSHKIETDVLAIKAGVNGIAYPSEEACKFVEKLGLSVRFHDKCCSLAWRDFLAETSCMNA